MFLVFTALNDAYAGYNTPDTKLKVNTIGCITMPTNLETTRAYVSAITITAQSFKLLKSL